MRLLEEEPMNLHTTFRTGGPAKWFCPVSCVSEAAEVLRFAGEKKAKLYVIGRGSNLLVSDKGIDGVVMEVSMESDGDFGRIRIRDDRIEAGAGASLSAIAKEAMRAGLSGMAFASGIPGTLGGGISMNAGAYGGEMKDIIEYVEVIRPDVLLSGEEEGMPPVIRLDGKDMHFGYRRSRCQEENLLIVGAGLRLTHGDPAVIEEEMRELNRKRREKQPLEYPSAGSTFKRPEGHFAGKLIQEAGLKGVRIGGAEVSEKHSGFVINTGGATSTDIYRLIRHVQDEVFRSSGVRLEPEVRLLGEFDPAVPGTGK